MSVIASQTELDSFCARLPRRGFIAVDTEFMRESTYYSKLCLIQIASEAEAVAIDPLAEGLDLGPLIALMDEPAVLKVFHAGRQDIEIFHQMTGRVPAPLFDTQVAAMACGFGESVGFEGLVWKLTGKTLDKHSRFADWSKRPLTERQLEYALDDVRLLRPCYTALAAMLAENGRSAWLEEEMAILTSPQTYALDPRQAWQRLKYRNRNPRFLAVLRELAAWREWEAQKRDLPRQRLLKDEALLDIAAQAPKNVEQLARTRGLARSIAEGSMGAAILQAIAAGAAVPEKECPKPPPREQLPNGIGPIVEMLKVLLKIKCDESGVAAKLLASSDDLERIAARDDAPVAALSGWRRTVFGEDALALKQGRIALAIKRGRISLVRLDGADGAAP
jgi:ribonuclease D